MGLFRKRSVADSVAISTAPIVLADRAIHCLYQAIEVEPENSESLVEERVTWQPDSWLLQRTWQTLADGGAGEEALRVAQMVEPRAPLAPAQALYRLAQQSIVQPTLANLVRRELRHARQILFIDPKFADPKFGEHNNGENKNSVVAGDTWRQIERLLFYGAGAAISGDTSLALACIERADQWERVWERVMITPEPRNLLAQIVARVGLHPLTSQFVTLAVRRYEDSGAQFLHQIASIIGPRVPHEQLPRRIARLLQRCVETFEFSTLTTLTARRYAANLFGQAGRIHELLDQIVTISNVQEARRDSGLSGGSGSSGGRGDSQFFRQVKRLSANPDVDFQVYTLQEAIQAMPVRTISRDERIALADKLAELAVRSDGWTAAGATSSLMELGAYKYAVNVVDHIPSQDPTRSEGVIALVRALLAMGETKVADEQVRKALAWVKSLDTRNPERATIWGLVEIYLDAKLPDAALRLLEQRYTPPHLRRTNAPRLSKWPQ